MQTWLKLKKNPELWQRYFLREKIIQAIRKFFLKEKFHEVETPLLRSSVVPESYLEVFETYLLDRQRRKRRMFLATSPEASLKKLLVAGIGNCFEITKSFRNTETGSNLHNPEFTILEWYRVGADYQDVMRDCENLLSFIHKYLKLPKSTLVYQGKSINLSAPWERISVIEAFEKYSGVDFDDITRKSGDMFPRDLIAQVVQKKGYLVEKNNTWEEIFNQIFLNEVEPHLGNHGRPTIIYDYPQPLAAIAKLKDDDPRIAERFEFYIRGLELGDCYNESTDAKYLKKKYKEEMALIKKKGKTQVLPDEDFLQAMSYKLSPYSGIAVGVDRLIMLFMDVKSVADTLFFPCH